MDLELFERDRHVTFLQMMYQLLPSPYQSQEINRLTLAYFVISGLDLLNSLDRLVRFENCNVFSLTFCWASFLWFSLMEFKSWFVRLTRMQLPPGFCHCKLIQEAQPNWTVVWGLLAVKNATSLFVLGFEFNRIELNCFHLSLHLYINN